MNDESGPNKTKWNVRLRRMFIEHRLFWRGRIGLTDLIDTLGMSRTQASQDLNSYIRDFPDHLSYDKSARTYRPGEGFRPQYAAPDANGQLQKLLAISEGKAVSNADWELFCPDVIAPPIPSRGAQATITRDVLLAIEKRRILNISYQSMPSPNPTGRSIAPHAIAHDGFRWHARALCLKDNVFKDFVLGRMLTAKLSEKIDFDASDDTDWTNEITLTITSHPDLSEGQRRIVELDYGMENGTADLTVRKSMLYYTMKRLGLDTDPAARRAQEQHIVLRNVDDVFGALGRAQPW